MEGTIEERITGRVESQKDALYLLTDAPYLSLAQTLNADFDGKRVWEDEFGSYEKGCYLKLVAAVNYERIAKSSRDEKEKLELLNTAAWAYTRAATNADKIRYNMVSIRCRIRASLIRNQLITLNPENASWNRRELSNTNSRILSTIEVTTLNQLQD